MKENQGFKTKHSTEMQETEKVVKDLNLGDKLYWISLKDKIKIQEKILFKKKIPELKE